MHTAAKNRLIKSRDAFKKGMVVHLPSLSRSPSRSASRSPLGSSDVGDCDGIANDQEEEEEEEEKEREEEEEEEEKEREEEEEEEEKEREEGKYDDAAAREHDEPHTTSEAARNKRPASDHDTNVKRCIKKKKVDTNPKEGGDFVLALPLPTMTSQLVITSYFRFPPPLLIIRWVGERNWY